MAHDATKVLMGSTLSSSKDIQIFENDPATFKAGLCVSRDSAGDLSLAKSDGMRMGVSLGANLSKTAKTSVVRAGLSVPVIIDDAFTPALGAKAHVSDTTGKCGTAGEGYTVSDMTYVSGVLTGIAEDGTEVRAALVDMPGGI